MRLAWVGLVVMTVATRSAVAQDAAKAGSRASIVGRVSDPAGAPLEHIAVSIPGLSLSTTTNARGEYAITDLPATVLGIEFRAIGRRAVQRQVVTTAGQAVKLEIVLEASAVEMPSIVVTGTPTASNPLTPADVSVVSADQMRAKATGSLGQTLLAIPGVSLYSQGPSAGYPVLRGLGLGHIKILRDGLAQENFQDGPKWPPAGNLASIDRIEVVRGPATLLYGPSAIGGAVNLVPRALPRGDNGHALIEGLAEAQYFGNNNERYGHGELGGDLGGGIGFRGGVSRRMADNMQVPNEPTFGQTGQAHAPIFTGELPNTGFENSEAYGQLGKSASWGQVRGEYSYWDGKNNQLFADGTASAWHQQNKDARLSATLVAGGFLLKPVVLYEQVNLLHNTLGPNYTQSLATNGWNQDLTNDAYTGRMEVQHPNLGGLHGTWGTEYNRQEVTVRKSTVEPPSVLKNVGIFGFEEYPVSQRVDLTAGLRYDHRTQVANSNSLVSLLPADQQAAALDRTYSAVTGSVGAGFRLADALVFAVNTGIGFRPPSSVDLYTNNFLPALGGFQHGDPLLQPERSYNAEGSLRLETRRATATAVAYYDVISNFIFVQKTNQTLPRNGKQVPVFVSTQADGRISGLELSGTAEPVNGLVLSGGYARLRTRNQSTGEQLPLMPADNLTWAARVVGRRVAGIAAPYLEFGGKHTWEKQVAGFSEPLADPDFTNGGTGPGVGSTDAYTVFRAGVGGRLLFGASNLIVNLSVENLFNTAYRDFLDTLKGIALGQGRNVSVRIAAPLVFTRSH